MRKLSTQALMIIALAVLAAVIVFAGPAACNRFRSMAAQSRVNASQGEAHSNSAADAVNTIAASGEASAASEQLTRENEQQIRAAPGSNVPVSSEADAAGRAALCRREAYRNDPKCGGQK